MASFFSFSVLAHSLIMAMSIASEWLVRKLRGLQVSPVSLSDLLATAK